MADAIREYVIKIRAEVKDALSQIDQLKGKFDKIEIKGEVDKSLGQSIEKLSGSIGKITQEMGELKTSFKEVDFKSFTSDMKSSFDDLKNSINEIKDSAKTLSEAFDFSGNKNNGFQNFINDLNKQITDLVDKYQESVRQIQNMTAQGFEPQSSVTPSVGTGSASKVLVQQAQEELSNVEEFAQIKKKTLELIREIAKEQKRDQKYIDMAASDESMEGITYAPSDYSKARDQLKNLEDLLQIVGKSKEVQEELKKAELSRTEISTARKALGKRVDAILKESVAEINPSAEPKQMRVQLNYDIADSDDKEKIKQKAIDLVNKIQAEVQNIVQEEVSKNPIRIPISFGTSDTQLVDEQNKEKILDAIEVPVKPITDGLLEEINSKIHDITDQVGSIDIKINPLPPDSGELKGLKLESKTIKDTTKEIESEGNASQIAAKQKEAFMLANDRIAAVTPKAGNAVRNTTREIGLEGVTASRVAEQLGQLLPSGGATTPTTADIPPIQIVNPVIDSDKVTVVADGQIHQTTSGDVVMEGVSDRQIITDGDFGVPEQRKPRRYLADILARQAMKGRKMTDWISAYWEGNQFSDIKKTSKELFLEGMTALQKDIKAVTRTQEDVQQRDYFSKAVKYNNKEWAFYGKAGQSLVDFQEKVIQAFTVGKADIQKQSDELHETMQKERTSTELVDSEINGKRVSPWMKRLLDFDKYKEKNELKSDRIKARIKKDEEVNPKYYDEARTNFLKEADKRIDALRDQKNEIVEQNKAYLETSKQLELTQKALKAVSQNATREEFTAWYSELSDKNGMKSFVESSPLKRLLDEKTDYSTIRDQIVNTLADNIESLNTSLGQLKQTYENNAESKTIEKIENQLQGVITERSRLASADKSELAKEAVKREHSAYRISLVDANTGGLTEEFEKMLVDVEKKEKKDIATRASRDAIRQVFGADALKKPNEKGLSRVEVKDENTLRLIQKFEESGLFVDDRTGLLSTASGKTPLSKTQATGDLFDRIKDIGQYGQTLLDDQVKITQALEENEALVKSYVDRFNDAINSGGYNEEGVRAIGKQMQEAFLPLKELNPQQIYEFATEYLDELSESRRKESRIKANIKDVVSKAVEAQMKRPIDRKTYESNKRELDDIGSKIKYIENRMDKVNEKTIGVDQKTGKPVIVYGLDPTSGTQYDQAKRRQLLDRQREIRKQQFGYELANGTRGWNGALVNKRGYDSLSYENSKVINLGLSPSMQKKYASVPNPVNISKPFFDENGIQVEGLREAVGASADELKNYVTILKGANKEINASLSKFPKTPEKIQEYVDKHVKDDIEVIRTERNVMVGELKNRFENYKEQHSEQFLFADQDQRTGLTKKFIKENSDMVRMIQLADKSIKALENNEPVQQSAKIQNNNRKLDQLNDHQEELSRFIIEQLGTSDSEMSNILYSLSSLRKTEAGARRELDDYTYEYVNDKYSQNTIFNDQGYIDRKEYYEKVQKDREKAQKALMRRLPLNNGLYDTEVGTLGQTQATSLTGSAIQELIGVIEEQNKIESENFYLRQSIQNSETQTARSQREQIWRDNLEAQRSNFESAQRTNETNIKQFEQLVANMGRVQKRDEIIKNRQAAEEERWQRKSAKFSEIGRKIETPKDKLLEEVNAEKEQVLKGLTDQIATLEDNLNTTREKIVSENQILKQTVEAKETEVESAKQALSEAQNNLSKTSLSVVNQTKLFSQDQQLQDLQKELEEVRTSGGSVRKIKEAIKSRQDEIIADYEDKLITAIYNVQDAIDESADEAAITSLSNEVLRRKREYESVAGKKYIPQDFINDNEDPIQYAIEHGNIEESIVNTAEQRLALANNEVRIAKQNLVASEEKLSVIYGTAKSVSEEDALVRQYVQTQEELNAANEKFRDEQKKRAEEIKYISAVDRKAGIEKTESGEEKQIRSGKEEYEEYLLKRNGFDKAEYEEWKRNPQRETKKIDVATKIAGERKKAEQQREKEIVKSQKQLEKNIVERLRYEQALADKKQKAEAENQKQETPSISRSQRETPIDYVPENVPYSSSDEYEENYEAQSQMIALMHQATEASESVGQATQSEAQASSNLEKAAESATPPVERLASAVGEVGKVINFPQTDKAESRAASPKEPQPRIETKPKNVITFNGKQYLPLPGNQGKANLDSIWNAPELQGLKNTKGGRYTKKGITGIKNVLKGYALTGDTGILEDIESVFKGGRKGTRGFASNIKNELKDSIRAFAKREIAQQSIPYTAGFTPASTQIAADSASTSLTNVGTSGNSADAGLEQVANSAPRAAEALKKFPEYCEDIALGMERIERARIVEKAGLTQGDDYEKAHTVPAWSAYNLVGANNQLWNAASNRGLLKEGSEQYQAIRKLMDEYTDAYLDHFKITKEGIKEQLAQISKIDPKEVGFKPHNTEYIGAWQHFHSIDENGHSTDKELGNKDYGYTYKTYARFSKPEYLNRDNITAIMKALSSAGFKGQVKVPGTDVDRFITSSDQLVVHGTNAEMQKLAYNILNEKFGSFFSSLKAGFDLKNTNRTRNSLDDNGASFSQLIISKQREQLLEESRKMLRDQLALSNETPVSTTPALPLQETVKAEEQIGQVAQAAASQVEGSMQRIESSVEGARGAVQELNDSMITLETGATDGARVATEVLKVYSEKGRLLGASKRNNTPYFEFAENKGLAEAVLATEGRLKFDTDFWVQSRANAQAYLDTLVQVKEAEESAITAGSTSNTTPQIEQQNQLQAEFDETKTKAEEMKAAVESAGQAQAQVPLAQQKVTAPETQAVSAITDQSSTALQNEAVAASEAAGKLQEKAAAEQAAADATRAAAQAAQTAAQNTHAETAATGEARAQIQAQTSQKQIPAQTQAAIQNQGAEIAGESGAFDELISTLTVRVPDAVNAKTSAFQEEANTVAALANEEANAFNGLIAQLEKIAGLATDFKFNFSIQGGEQFNEEFLKNFDILKTGLEEINPAQFEALGSAVTALGTNVTGNQNLSKTFSELGEAVKTFAKELDNVELYGNFDKISGMVERISTSGAELKNLASILKTQKPGKYSADAQMDSYITEYKKQLDYLNNPNRIAEYQRVLFKKEQQDQILAEGGDLTKSTILTGKEATFLTDFESRMNVMGRLGSEIDSLKKSLKSLGKEGLVPMDMLKQLKQQTIDFGKSMNDASTYTRAFAEAPEDYTKKLAGLQKKMDAISQAERNQFGAAFNDLNNTFQSGAQGLVNGTRQWEEFSAEMDRAFKAYNRFKRVNPEGKPMMSGIAGGVDDVKAQISNYLKQNYKLVTQDVSGGKIDSQGIASFSAQVVDANNNVKDLKINWDSWTGQVGSSASTAAEQFKGRFMSLFTDLQAKSKQLFVYWTATFLNPYRLIGTAKQAINVIKELDSAMTELKKVSSETAETYADFQTKSFSMANEVGTTAEQIIKSTADWSRIGESFEEAQKSAKESTILMNVSEFQNIDDATDSLIAMSQAYKELSKADIIDKLNNIGRLIA